MTPDDPLRRYLDGEVPLDRVPEPRRAEAEAWGRLLDAYRQGTGTGAGAPAWLEDRVMAEIEALPPRSVWQRFWGWTTRPQSVRVPPWSVALAGMAVLALLATARSPDPGVTGGVGPAPSPGAQTTVVYVQFVLEAPGARSVAVGGDFDGWSADHPLEDPDGDGVWVGRVAVEPGVHTYMFLVDGDDWVTDPRAARYTDDGFGNQNAVLAVAGPEA